MEWRWREGLQAVERTLAGKRGQGPEGGQAGTIIQIGALPVGMQTRSRLPDVREQSRSQQLERGYQVSLA